MAEDGQAPVNLHGTALAVDGKAVLLRGPSGSGKSDLALRALAASPNALLPGRAVLVADDRVILGPQAGALRVSAPEILKGMLEVRGIGIIPVEAVASACLVLVADLVPSEAVERMPDAGEHTEIVPGVHIPRIGIAPFEASAPLKLLLALARAGSS